MTRKPKVDILAGTYMTTATRDGEPIAAKWEAGDAWWVARPGSPPEKFADASDATSAFMAAAMRAPGGA